MIFVTKMMEKYNEGEFVKEFDERKFSNPEFDFFEVA